LSRYRDLEQLMNIGKIIRVGLPRSKDVRYEARKQPILPSLVKKEPAPLVVAGSPTQN
jgi:hypothetical protein